MPIRFKDGYFCSKEWKAWRGSSMSDTETIKLPGEWGLRKLSLAPGDHEWALQFRGMDWIKITDFLPSERSDLDNQMRKFADDMKDHKRE